MTCKSKAADETTWRWLCLFVVAGALGNVGALMLAGYFGQGQIKGAFGLLAFALAGGLLGALDAPGAA